jgi:hypothetical protein
VTGCAKSGQAISDSGISAGNFFFPVEWLANSLLLLNADDVRAIEKSAAV